MSRNRQLSAPGARHSRLPFSTGSAVRLAVLLAALAPAIGAQGSGRAGQDSASLHDAAVMAVHAYEAAAFHHWPPNARPCTPGRGAAACAGGWCEPASGRGCTMGWTVPCPVFSTTQRPAFCEADAATLGQEYRMRDSAQIVRERDALIALLDTLATRLPGDNWIAGQRIHYLVSAGRVVQAYRAAGSCRGIPAWCGLLTGFVHSRARSFDAAEIAFGNAMRLMTPESRCEWRDLEPLLPSESIRGRYASMPCGSRERDVFEERFWWLSDPSWLIDGNDRQTAHIARRVEQRFFTDWMQSRCDSCVQVQGVTARPTVMTNEAEFIRTGRNDSWLIEYSAAGGRGPGRGRGGGRGRGAGGGGAGAGAAGADMGAVPPDSIIWQGPVAVRRSSAARYHFVPSERALLSPLGAQAGDWRPTGGPPPGIGRFASASDTGLRTPVPERHTPPYAGLVLPVPHWQMGMVRRGDSAVIVAVFDLERDATLRALLTSEGGRSMDWESGLIGYSIERSTGLPRQGFEMRRESVPPLRWTGLVGALWDSSVVSFEVFGDGSTGTPPAAARGGVLARTRLAIGPPAQAQQRVQISDVFLFSPRGDEPEALTGPASVLDRLITAPTLDPRSEVGLYWEQYGVAAGERTRFKLEMIRLGVRRSFWQRIGFSRGPSAALSREWEERGPGIESGGVWVRSTRLELGALPTGEYELRLSAAVNGQRPTMAVRRLSVGG